MTPEQFAYWMQGFVELNGGMPTPEQWQSIKEHLATVFNKVTPSLDDPNTFRVHEHIYRPYPVYPGVGNPPTWNPGEVIC